MAAKVEIYLHKSLFSRSYSSKTRSSETKIANLKYFPVFKILF